VGRGEGEAESGGGGDKRLGAGDDGSDFYLIAAVSLLYSLFSTTLINYQPNDSTIFSALIILLFVNSL